MRSPRIIKISDSFAPSGNSPELELFDQYISLPVNQRSELFAGTSKAAELIGLSQRTIQLWIETGAIDAFLVGKKYVVSIPSLKAYIKNRHKNMLE